MNRDNNNTIKDLDWELFLLFIDEERNKDLEKRFSTYINEYFIFDKKDSSFNIKNNNRGNDENKENKENKAEPKVIKFEVYQ